MTKYFIYWLEQKSENQQHPTHWHCYITSIATEQDLPLFEQYNNFISEVTDNRVNVGWIENKKNESIDNFIIDQNFYNDINDDIFNEYVKFEYDWISFEKLKNDINEIVSHYYSLSDNHKDDFKKTVNNCLVEKFYEGKKAFVLIKDIWTFNYTEVEENKTNNKKKKRSK